MTPTLAAEARWSHAFTADSASHDAAGASIEQRFGRRWGIALEGELFAPFDSSLPASVARAGGAWPRNETAWVATLDATFAILPGHEGGRWELCARWGAGLISSRPVSVIDSAFRSFAYRPKLAFDVGVGVRFFILPSVAIGLEIRDVLFAERLESASVATRPGERSDPSTWYVTDRLTHAVQTSLGLRVSVPGL